MRGVVALVLLVLGLAGQVRAADERLIVSLATHRLQITSNFVGSEIVLFGAIHKDNNAPLANRDFDVAVVVRGPRANILTRRKERVLGIWMNTQSREFQGVPTAYAYLSDREPAELAPIETRRRFQIGFDGLTLLQRARPGDDPTTGEPFRQAFMRVNRQRGLYVENPSGVTFLTPSLFRATIAVAPNTTVGEFDVEVFLFENRQLVTRAQTNFEITKVGFEAYVANAAQDNRLLYGIAAAMLALLTGWAASVVFRRD